MADFVELRHGESVPRTKPDTSGNKEERNCSRRFWPLAGGAGRVAGGRAPAPLTDFLGPPRCGSAWHRRGCEIRSAPGLGVEDSAGGGFSLKTPAKTA